MSTAVAACPYGFKLGCDDDPGTPAPPGCGESYPVMTIDVAAVRARTRRKPSAGIVKAKHLFAADPAYVVRLAAWLGIDVKLSREVLLERVFEATR